MADNDSGGEIAAAIDEMPSPLTETPQVKGGAESGWSPADFLMLMAGGLTAEPLCHAGWDGIVSGEHVSRGIAAVIAGFMIGGGSGSFHWWKSRIGEPTRRWVARNSRWWLLAAVVLLIADLAGPSIYQRAVLPPSRAPSQTGDVVAKSDYELLGKKLETMTNERNDLKQTLEKVDEKVAILQQEVLKAQSQLAELSTLNQKLKDAHDSMVELLHQKIELLEHERDQLKQQIATAQSQLEIARQGAHVPPPPPPPEDQIPVRWQPDFQLNWTGEPKFIWMRFVGEATSLAQIKDAYIITDLIGRREQLRASNPINSSETWGIDQIEPIVTGAPVYLIYSWPQQISLADFMSQWGAFEFHVVYDGKEYVKSYSQEYINDKLQRELRGIVGPRVTPKKNGDK
jgi:hypothetical protein